jgi:GNAT superfamily N-acetyltransferase
MSSVSDDPLLPGERTQHSPATCGTNNAPAVTGDGRVRWFQIRRRFISTTPRNGGCVFALVQGAETLQEVDHTSVTGLVSVAMQRDQVRGAVRAVDHSSLPTFCGYCLNRRLEAGVLFVHLPEERRTPQWGSLAVPDPPGSEWREACELDVVGLGFQDQNHVETRRAHHFDQRFYLPWFELHTSRLVASAEVGDVATRQRVGRRTEERTVEVNVQRPKRPPRELPDSACRSLRLARLDDKQCEVREVDLREPLEKPGDPVWHYERLEQNAHPKRRTVSAVDGVRAVRRHQDGCQAFLFITIGRQPEHRAYHAALAVLTPVEYDPSRRDAVLALMREVWAHSASPDEWDWWYGDPRGGRRVLSVVVDEGRIVGVSTMSVLRMCLGGEERDAAFAMDAVTHPDYRGRGLWSALELRNEEKAAAGGAAAALGFTNWQAGPILVGKLGWRDVTQLRLWLRPLRLRVDEPRLRQLPADETLEQFGPETDAVYAEASRKWGNHVVRHAEYLNWRFAESPRSYRILAARSGRRVTGWAVVGLSDFAGIGRIGLVADLVAARFSVARDLLRRSARAIDARGLAALVSPAERAAYVAAGFLPTTRRTRFIGKAFDQSVKLPTRRDAWHFTFGDYDSF